MSLENLIQTRADLWRGRTPSPTARDGISSGFAGLDALLPGAGWPRDALVEVLAEGPGRGGLDLVMPAVARLSRGDRWVALISPPLMPYAPGWAGAGVNLSHLLLVHAGDEQERLWALEQALRSGVCSAVLSWAGNLRPERLRRLQLAAETGGATGFLFRPPSAARSPSPAHLRVRATPRAQGLEVRVLKCRGGWPAGPLRLDAPAGLVPFRKHA
ncbi:MAG: translesion DNA synthesis-associated protein ImuA [Chromatiales bacterium]|jgi:hypothetical protein